MEKKISFSSDCKIHDGKNPVTKNYESFIFNIIRPKSVKIGVTLEQIKNGFKPNSLYRPRMTIDQSWQLVDKKYKDGVIDMIVDLVNRFDDSLNKPIPLVTGGSSNCLFLNYTNAGLIYCLKEFLAQNSPNYMSNKIKEYNIFFEKEIDTPFIDKITINNNTSHETFFKMDEEIEKERQDENIIKEQEDFFDKILE